MKKKMVKRILACALAATMVVAMAGCGSSKDTKETSAKSGEESKKPASVSDIEINEAGVDATGHEGEEAPEGVQEGTTYNHWTNYDIPIYTPWMDNRAAVLSYQIYDNLLVKWRGDVNDIRCNIAESYEVSDDGLVWDFKLRDDVTFSDGSGLTAQDFIATWDVMETYQPRPFASVESYEAVSDYELKIVVIK